MPPIRRPAGKIIASRIVRELHPLLAGDVHQINIIGTRLSRPVLADPGEGQKLAVRRPVGRNRITLIGEALYVRAVRFHGVDLRLAGASADEGELAPGLAVPCGSNVGSLVAGQAAGVSSGCVDDEDVGIAVSSRGKGD